VRKVNGVETVISVGSGIEKEVIHALFAQFQKHRDEWFTPRADGFYTLSTTTRSLSSQHVSESRLRNLTILGAATALWLLHRLPTVPLDPVFLHFLIHDCNLDSIHPAILGEWHPSLRQTISNWVDLGPDGDASPFGDHFTFIHDIHVSFYSLFMACRLAYLSIMLVALDLARP
jgi:hypothetical protein